MDTNMISLETRLANFLDTVKFVADERRQQAVWVEKHQGVSSVISIGELYAQFFDDNEIDDFIAHELDSAPLSEGQKLAVRRFRDALDAFSRSPLGAAGGRPESSFISSPEWRSLVNLAQATLELF